MLRKHEKKAQKIVETLAPVKASLHVFPCPLSLILQREGLEEPHTMMLAEFPESRRLPGACILGHMTDKHCLFHCRESKHGFRKGVGDKEISDCQEQKERSVADTKETGDKKTGKKCSHR
jgi:hypothetical protein